MTLSLRTPILLTAIFFMIVTSGCALTQKTKKVKPLRITGGEEILVGEGVINMAPIWCAKQEVIVYTKPDIGIFYYDIPTKKTHQISDSGHNSIGCTPDGKWFVYVDKFNSWYDKDYPEKGNYNLWRYEFSTKKRQQFMVVDSDDIESHILSPIASKLYLGRKPGVATEMPEPKWEVSWGDERDPSLHPIWLKDGSALIGHHFEKGKTYLSVETFSPVRKTTYINTPYSFSVETSDNQNNIYLHIEHTRTMSDYLARCSLTTDKDNLSCQAVFKDFSHIYDFGIFADSKTIAYTTSIGECVKTKEIGSKDSRCIANSKYYTRDFIALSPDNKWLAYTTKTTSKYGVTIMNLYITRLTSK